MRARWYQFMAALEEEVETQRKGIVLVAFGFPNVHIHHFAGRLRTVLLALPMRIVARHFCLLNHTVHPIVRLMLRLGGEEYGLRSRIHCTGR